MDFIVSDEFLIDLVLFGLFVSLWWILQRFLNRWMCRGTPESSGVPRRSSNNSDFSNCKPSLAIGRPHALHSRCLGRGKLDHAGIVAVVHKVVDGIDAAPLARVPIHGTTVGG